MKPASEPYLEQAQRWPPEGRHVLAHFDDETVLVYQAYRPSIGRFAVEHGRFGGGDFSYDRMSWIKPNFLWMTYRSGWGTKEGQEVTLALRVRRTFFDRLLAEAVPSTFDPRLFADREQWQRAVATSMVRVQWDPDHDPSGAKLPRRRHPARPARRGSGGVRAARTPGGPRRVRVRDRAARQRRGDEALGTADAARTGVPPGRSAGEDEIGPGRRINRGGTVAMPWRIVERKLGRAGGERQRAARQREWDRRHGADAWAVGYVIDGEFVLQEDALESVFYGSYEAHFRDHPDDLRELIALAKVLRNPHAEATTGVDLQVPAIMKYLQRHGLALEGSEVADVGTWQGERSHALSVRLSPLHVRCALDAKRTLEDWWQSMKCLAVWAEE